MNGSQRIYHRRKELGITQEKLAQMVGYQSRSSINKIEKGFHEIPPGKIEAFAKALKLSPAQLMGWEGEVRRVSDEELTFALFGEHSAQVTPEMLKEAKDFAQYILLREQKKENDLDQSTK